MSDTILKIIIYLSLYRLFQK